MTRPAWMRALGVTLALAVGIAVGLQVSRDWETVAYEGRRHLVLRPQYLVVAWLAQSAGWLLVVDTWSRIMGRMGAEASFSQHLRVHTWSGLANVLPGSIWMPMTRVSGYRGLDVPALTVGAALAVEWLVLGLAGLALYVLSAPFSQLPPAVNLVALLTAAGLAAVILHPQVFTRLMGGAAVRLRQGGLVARPAWPDLGAWFLRELMVLALAGVGLYFVMRSLGPLASLPVALGVTGLTLALANLLAWLPASAVLKDAGMVVLLTPFYGTAAMALAVVVVWRLWLTLVQVSWVCLAVLSLRLGQREGL